MSKDKRTRLSMSEHKRLMAIEVNTVKELRRRLSDVCEAYQHSKELNDTFVATSYRHSEEMCKKMGALERERDDLYATNKAFVTLINGG